MGSGIAEVCARSGCDVVVHEINAEASEAALDRIAASLLRAVDRGKLDTGTADETLNRIDFSIDLADQSDRQLVIEAVSEDETIKTSIFKLLDEIVVDSEAILASNTSSIPITRLAAATARPQQVLGLHFFNPVPVMNLVEMVTTTKSSEETERRAREFVDSLDKTLIVAKDRAGFIVNMLMVPYLLGAVRMLDDGHASLEDIDVAMKLGLNHPMGPLELSDFVGLDTIKQIAEVLFEEYRDPMFASPPLLTRMVEAGDLGRKTGRGFYDYS
jgi:3-hydroxybutyryl-CoA dehydrogenase